MSMYSDYLKERTSDDILETDQGFATFRYLDDKTVYIVDVYVKPEFRKSGVVSDMADTIVRTAKISGCNKLIGSVVPSTKGSTVSLKVLLGYGMKLKSSQNDFILFEKDI